MIMLSIWEMGCPYLGLLPLQRKIDLVALQSLVLLESVKIQKKKEN